MIGGLLRTSGDALTGTSENRGALLIRNGAICLAGLLGVVLIIRLVLTRDYNYDELQHSHVTWLVSIGEVPYRDFADNHFPFLWILLSPLMRVLPESPVTLTILRGLALLLNAVFLGALGTLICSEHPAKQRIWAVACFGLVVFSPPAVDYLIQFRPDPLGNALLFSGLLWLWLRGSTNAPAAFVGGFCIGAGVLVNTKFVLLPFLFGAVALAVHLRGIRQIWPSALAICLGFSACLLCDLLLLVLMRIPLDGAWLMVVVYNATVENIRTFGFGLARTLVRQTAWLAYVLAGLIGCVALFVYQRQSASPLAAATFLFLLVSLSTTTQPWRQYMASWLLLASYFPARSLPVLAARLRTKDQIGVALFVLLIAMADLRTGFVDLGGLMATHRATQDRLIEWVVRRVPPDGFVVADFFFHPVFRRDTFFKTVFDFTVASSDGFEEFMVGLAPRAYSEHFQRSGYEKELEIRPPSLIVLPGTYARVQAQVLHDYLNRHIDSYKLRLIPGTHISVAERKTRGLPEPK
jgi:hypothetical protein